jgi:predicted ribosome quality control (RQC) complex YloA/Tae2 family protein
LIRRQVISLNWREIDTILEEIDIVGSHIQKIRQPDFKNLLLDLYKPGQRAKLLISLLQGSCRLHFLSNPKPNQIKLQRFAQLLRSRCKGGKIVRCDQPNGQRIICMEIVCGELITRLWIRLWNNRSNIIATDENNIILDSFFRRPNQKELSGDLFDPEIEGTQPDESFQLRELPGEGNYNSRIEDFYYEKEQIQQLSVLRSRAQTIATRLEGSLLKRREKISKGIDHAENADLIKQKADLIMSHAHAIQKGSTEFTTENWFDDNKEITIKLNPKLSARENADSFYKNFKKETASIERLLEDQINCETRLEQTRNQLSWIEGTQDLEKLSQWIDSHKNEAKQVTKSKNQTVGLSLISGEFTLLVGRTAKENDTLLRNSVRGNDTWLHTRDYAGGYVFIKNIPGKSIPLETLIDAGNLAVHYSKAKTGGEADLYYTQVKYLRRAKERPVGLVLPTQEKNLHIRIEKDRIDRLLNR